MNDRSHDGNFDKTPPVDVQDYDSKIRLFCGGYDEIFKLSCCCLKAVVPPQARILVAGAGSGMEIVTFAPLSPDWSFCGVDPSADMLSLARKKISDKKLCNPIRIVQGYVDDLDEEMEFDGATCILVMHFLKDDPAKLALLQSIRKRLKRGAPLVLVDGCGDPASRAFADTLDAWRQYPMIHGVYAETVEDAFRDVITKMVHFVPESHVLSLLSRAGFANIFRFYTGFLYMGWTAYKA